jgi:hypothetical protein
MTQAGMILGTAAYMSPEQAKGRPADKRSDVWAFGCVLYEMLTATRAFPGEDVSDTLAAVLKSDPDWSALPSMLPASIRSLIDGSLKRDRRERIGDLSTTLPSESTTCGGDGRAGQPTATTGPVETRGSPRGRYGGRRHCGRGRVEAEAATRRCGDSICVHAAAGAAVDAATTSPRHFARRHTHRVHGGRPAVSPRDVGARG